MMIRHPALSIELEGEARDLRRYSRELAAAGDADQAAVILDQASHVDGWREHVAELEADAKTLAGILDNVELDNVDKLAARFWEMSAECEAVPELLADLFPRVTTPAGRTITEPAKSATLSTVRERVETLCEALELDKYAGIDAAIAEAKKRVDAHRALEAQVEELREVVTRDVRADALDRIAELERDNAQLRAELEASASTTSKARADSALKSRKAAWLDEILDRCPIPRDVMESVYGLLERDDASWDERCALIGRLSVALAERVQPTAGVEAPTAATPPEVDESADKAAREALRAALVRRDEAKAARGALNSDHPLQLAYEGELEAAFRAAKPKRKVPRLEGNAERLDVQMAVNSIPADVSTSISKRYAALVKAAIDSAEAELAASKAAVSEAAAAVTPRTMSGARTMIAAVSVSSYMTQTAPATYARAMAQIHAAAARAACPGVEVELVEDVKPYAELGTVRVFADVEALDVEAMKARPMSMVEMVRLAWKNGANPRVYWPTLPHDFEAANNLDQFGNMLEVRR
jgi:hypothetical protein